ncbi:thiazole tautomerase TenI [Ammoniphilus sp. CFH 90114]|uniref:thiazole tautomerase TenI n=1 Tax=Ammoniphilus sp. CFH 90114 TaxID=2493665 RepID=UPI00100F687F|nr:thiazole tautomerase TenI [Ammoniphilus sp. CFH 90114]RXT05682.1 thiazole tautomerase TenI [Ammoniphilus sp. CFH 90114]
MPIPELHVISNGKQPLDQFADIAALVHPVVSALHLREKAKTARELHEWIECLVERGVPTDKIYLNDRVDVAWSTRIRGVQLAYHSLDPVQVKPFFPTLRIGRSVHSAAEAVAMEEQGADYLLFGHIFATGSKPGLEARGLEALARVVDSVQIPVIAIGGIGPDQVKDVMETGAAGIAVMSGIVEAKDPLDVAMHYSEALLQGGSKNGIGL